MANENIKVYFNIRGRKWENKGQTSYFTNLEGWRIEKLERFDAGEIVCFSDHRKKDAAEVAAFDISGSDELPSIPLNPLAGDEDADVRERGRMKFTADALDFFSKEGEAGVSASNRIKGVVLHDILARVIVPEDLEPAVRHALQSGEVTRADSCGCFVRK